MDNQTTDAQTIINLENLIKGFMADIEKTRNDLKIQRDMLKSSIEGDKDFSEVAEQHKEIKRKENEIKQKIVKTDAAMAVKVKVNELSEELKEAQKTMSDYLNRYIALTNTSEFIGPNGELHKIIRSAKLVKKGSQED